jgi:hypothetical protein
MNLFAITTRDEVEGGQWVFEQNSGEKEKHPLISRIARKYRGTHQAKAVTAFFAVADAWRAK